MRDWVIRILRRQSIPLTLLWRGLEVSALIILVASGAVLIEVVRLALSNADPVPPTVWVLSPLPIHGQLAPFELVDEQGKSFGTRQLRGSVYLLLFTSSADERLAQYTSERMSALQAHLGAAGADARLVAIDMAPPGVSVGARLADTREGRAVPRHVLSGQALPLFEQVVALLPGALKAQWLQEVARDWSHYVLLVDQAGGVRGFHDLAGGARVFDTLVEQVRCVNECGPVPAQAGLSEGATLESAACQDRRRRGRR